MLIQKINSCDPPISEDRDYIGASLVGESCWRKIWYSIKKAPATSFTSKLARTFNIGKYLEIMLLEEIERSGVILLPRENCHFVDPAFPLFQGNVDGIIVNPDDSHTILEIKTANAANFALFEKLGVRKWNLRYYYQLQAYMGLANINNTILLVLNKNSSDLSEELVSFKPEEYEELRSKIKTINDSITPPPRLNDSPFFYMCKNCQFNQHCHQKGN